jgi:hypothetical protein
LEGPKKEQRVGIALARSVTMIDQSPLQHATHLDSLRKFARRKHISEDVVVAVFERERDHLNKGAKVGSFVDVLAEKRARRTLRRMKPA